MNRLLKYIGFFSLLAIVNILAFRYDYHLDLTEDQKYTVSSQAQEKIKAIPEGTVITVLFEGDIPASFKNYKGFIDYYLREVRSLNSDIEFIYQDPSEGTPQEIAQMKEYLRSYGVSPISRRVAQGESISQSLLYPYISVHNQDRVVFIDLLESKEPGESEEEAILNAQIKFESKLIRAFRDITSGTSGLVGIIGGEESALLAQGLNGEEGKLGNYFFFPMNAGQLLSQVDTLDAIIVTLKNQDLNRLDLLAIDQCLMSGVPILWLVDKYAASVDSIGRYGQFIALPREYVAEDMLFKSGVRVSSDMLQSLDASPIPQVVGQEGGQPQTALIPFPYHILCQANRKVLGESNDPVLLKFTSSMDTLKTATAIQKRALLETSAKTSITNPPVNLDFNTLRFEPDPADYSAGPFMTGIELSGTFESYFNRRLGQEDKNFLRNLNLSFKDGVQSARQIVISDLDFILPMIGRDGSLYPAGYNFWDRQLYKGNTAFFAAIMETLVHDNELLFFTKKELATSILDREKFDSNRYWYFFLMIGLPILFVMSLILSIRYYRKRKYGTT